MKDTTTTRAPMRTLGMIARAIYGDEITITPAAVDLIETAPLVALGIMQRNKRARSEEVVDLIAELPSDPAAFAAGADGMGQFWIGYYHYLTAMDIAAAHWPNHMEAVGQALYGDRWQSELARAIGVDSRRVRAWMGLERPIPPGVWADLAALLRERGDTINAVLDRIAGDTHGCHDCRSRKMHACAQGRPAYPDGGPDKCKRQKKSPGWVLAA